MSQTTTPDFSDMMPPAVDWSQEDAKCNKMQPNATLSPPQCVVLESLLTVDTVSEAARKADVHRTTIYRWLHDDRDFQDA